MLVRVADPASQLALSLKPITTLTRPLLGLRPWPNRLTLCPKGRDSVSPDSSPARPDLDEIRQAGWSDKACMSCFGACLPFDYRGESPETDLKGEQNEILSLQADSQAKLAKMHSCDSGTHAPGTKTDFKSSGHAG